MRKKALLILNPKAGLKKANRLLTDIIVELQAGGYSVSVSVTEKQGDGEKIAFEESAKVDLVVAVGGDGTFNEVVSGVIKAGKDTVVGYIPSGSTNDFASSLKLSGSPVKAARDIAAGKVRKLDVGSFNGRIFTYVASFGAFTGTSYSTPQEIKNSLGHLAYIIEGIKDIGNIKGTRIKVRTENKVFDGRYIFGAVSNSTSLGGLLKINPDVVDMNDGLLEILLIKEPQNLNDLTQILTALNTQNYSSPMIDFCSVTSATVYAGENMNWTIDGEKQEGSKVIEVKNIANALSIITP